MACWHRGTEVQWLVSDPVNPRRDLIFHGLGKHACNYLPCILPTSYSPLIFHGVVDVDGCSIRGCVYEPDELNSLFLPLTSNVLPRV